MGREEKGEGEDRHELGEKKENQKGREQFIQESIPYVLSTAWNTQRDSQGYIEKIEGGRR